MSDNVVPFNGITKCPLSPAMVLDAAKKSGLRYCIVVGETEDGEFYFASSISDGPTVLWDLAKAQKKLLEIVDG